MSIDINSLSPTEALNEPKICDDMFCPSAKKGSKFDSVISGNTSRDADTYQSGTQSKRDLVRGGLAELHTILENLTALCKSPICYNAYMGYKPCPGTNTLNLVPEVDRNLFDRSGCVASECLPSPTVKGKTLEVIYNKQQDNQGVPGCNKAMCPFSISKYFTKGLIKTNDRVTIPCNSDECPYTSTESKRNSNGEVVSVVEPCGGDACPYTTNINSVKSAVAETCGGETCPYNVRTDTFKPSADFAFLPSTRFIGGKLLEGCGGETCPFGPTSTNARTSKLTDWNMLGKSASPTLNAYRSPVSINEADPVGLCGRQSCPFAFVKTTPPNQVQASPCPAQCGTASPLLPTPSPALQQRSPCPMQCGNVSPLPAAPSICPYATANTYTDRFNPYSYDYGFLQEARRPYSGSTCPYLTRQDPDRTNINRNFYKHVYGKEAADLIRPSQSACDDSTCTNKVKQFSGGVCDGAPVGYSCDSPDVEPCGSPDCKLTKEDECCTGAPPGYTCDSPDVEWCASPDCKITKPKNECTLETCSAFKVLSFCKECGGAIVAQSKDIKEQKASANVDDGVAENATASDKKKKRSASKAPEDAQAAIDNIGNSRNMRFSLQNGRKSLKKKKKNKKKRLSAEVVLYDYPGVELGHKDCTPKGMHVPNNMGWLWNLKPAGNVKLWRGYKPGAVPKTVHKMMVKHRQELGIIDPMDFIIRKKRSKSSTKLKSDEPKHTVQLKKIDGEYTIIVSPLKDPKQTHSTENPYIDCTPMQFKIGKEPEKQADNVCPCDEPSDVPRTTSNDEVEFQYSPPAASLDTHPKKKKNMTEVETQYNLEDVPGVQITKKVAAKKNKNQEKGKKKGKK